MSQSQPTPPTEPIETTTPLQPATGTRETVDLTEAAPTDAQLLPTEREQTPGSQAPAAGQDKTQEARTAYDDAVKGRPDTSSAPQLQRSPNADPRQSD
ncbi:hypothetical protein [Ottowia beijingensis]|uniref:hypothetical protein n=1 Tax=Ottowia beijingensis TaxID=1207057 RepID=UPI0036418D15